MWISFQMVTFNLKLSEFMQFELLRIAVYQLVSGHHYRVKDNLTSFITVPRTHFYMVLSILSGTTYFINTYFFPSIVHTPVNVPVFSGDLKSIVAYMQWMNKMKQMQNISMIIPQLAVNSMNKIKWGRDWSNISANSVQQKWLHENLSKVHFNIY